MELSKDSPITIWLPSQRRDSLAKLKSYLKAEHNAFEDPEESADLHENFPYLTKLMAEMRHEHKSIFLPTEVCGVFLSMISLREDFERISNERAVKRQRPKGHHKSCRAECYPNNKEHTVENWYYADEKRDMTEDKKCEKAYNSRPTITGGLTHMSCNHGIVKGFTALQRGESPLLVVGPALRRLPSRVKAKRRYFIYDNACTAHKSSLRRFPNRVRNWTFLVDRTLGCSERSQIHFCDPPTYYLAVPIICKEIKYQKNRFSQGSSSTTQSGGCYWIWASEFTVFCTRKRLLLVIWHD